MAYTTIDDGSAHFNTLIWSGDNSTRNVTGVGFQPDWVWIKSRSDSAGHNIYDSSRGANKRLDIGGQTTETTNHAFGYVSSFNSDGFTLTPGSYSGYESGDTNMTGRTYVGWNWKANAGTTSSNTDGSVTSTVQANTTAGFSIVQWTGNATQGAKIGHGLGKVPKIIITKNRDGGTYDWNTWLTGFADNKYVAVNQTYTTSTDANTFPDASDITSTVFEIGSGGWINGSGNAMIAYCFAEIKGYSKFGYYTGNGTGSFGPFANGPFVYTGFKPAWVMIKRTDSTNGWTIFDSVRNPFNIVEKQLFSNSGGAEEADASHHAERDYLSNGFKLKGNGNDINANGASYFYMAFAEHPFVSSEGVPVTAR